MGLRRRDVRRVGWRAAVNQRPKRLAADLSLDKAMLQEGAKKA